MSSRQFDQPHYSSAWTIFMVFLRLGLTSFGGPVAHIGYFREEFVNRIRWLDEARFADLVALCQPVVRSASPSGCCAAATAARWPPGPVLPCRQRPL
jgi:hypothetical protein